MSGVSGSEFSRLLLQVHQECYSNTSQASSSESSGKDQDISNLARNVIQNSPEMRSDLAAVIQDLKGQPINDSQRPIVDRIKSIVGGNNGPQELVEHLEQMIRPSFVPFKEREWALIENMYDDDSDSEIGSEYNDSDIEEGDDPEGFSDPFSDSQMGIVLAGVDYQIPEEERAIFECEYFDPSGNRVDVMNRGLNSILDVPPVFVAVEPEYLDVILEKAGEKGIDLAIGKMEPQVLSDDTSGQNKVVSCVFYAKPEEIEFFLSFVCNISVNSNAMEMPSLKSIETASNRFVWINDSPAYLLYSTNLIWYSLKESLLERSEELENVTQKTVRLDPERYQQTELTPEKALHQLVEDYDGICIGEAHTDASLHWLREQLPELKERGLSTLFVEFAFYDTDAETLSGLSLGDEIPESILAAVDKRRGWEGLADLMKEAHKNGIKIVPIDSTLCNVAGLDSHSGHSDDRSERIQAFNYIASNIIRDTAIETKGKWMAVMGSLHVTTAKDDMDESTSPGVADVLGCPSVLLLGKNYSGVSVNCENYLPELEEEYEFDNVSAVIDLDKSKLPKPRLL